MTNNSRSGAVTLSMAAAAFLYVGSYPVNAAPWDFGTSVEIGVVYTDNLRLAPDGQEESEYVYTIAPTFSLSTEGDRLVADIRYRPEAYFFDTAPESDSIFHILDATLTGTLVRDAFFVDLSASSSQSIVSPELSIPTGHLPISSNRTDSTVIRIRPYWQQNLGFADVLADVSYVDTRYGEVDSTFNADVQDNTELLGSFNLNNHSRRQGVAWGLDYSYRRLEYDEAIPYDYQRAAVDLGYWVNGIVRLFGSGGLETNFDEFFESNLDDEFWELGFQYAPNQRFDLELAAGERGYGSSYRARITYQLRRGQTALTYTEQPSTEGEARFGQRPIVDTDNLDDLLNRPGGSDRFIRKRGQWFTTIEFLKSDASLRLFYEERSETTTATGEPRDDEKNSGGAFRWNWKFGVKSTLGFVVDYSKRQTPTRDGTLTRFSIDYAYRIGERVSIVTTAERSEDDSDNSVEDYVENQYRLTLRAEF